VYTNYLGTKGRKRDGGNAEERSGKIRTNTNRRREGYGKRFADPACREGSKRKHGKGMEIHPWATATQICVEKKRRTYGSATGGKVKKLGST